MVVDLVPVRAELATDAELNPKIQAAATQFQVVDDATAQVAADIDGDLAARLKVLGAKRDAWCKPLRKIANEISAEIKRVEAPLLAARQTIKSAITGYRARVAAAQQAALTQAASAQEVQRAVAVLTPQAPTGTAFRTSYRGEVVDPDQVPKDFWVIDQKKIDDAIKAAKGNITIPGVRVHVEETMVRRG